MSIRYLFLTMLLLAGLAPATFADPVSPLHNPINGLDVDDNARVQARDALIIINQLLHPTTAAVEPLVGTATLMFPDTTDDGRVTPRNALLGHQSPAKRARALLDHPGWIRALQSADRCLARTPLGLTRTIFARA